MYNDIVVGSGNIELSGVGVFALPAMGIGDIVSIFAGKRLSLMDSMGVA